MATGNVAHHFGRFQFGYGIEEFAAEVVVKKDFHRPVSIQELSTTHRFTNPANGATVGPVEDVTGKGWEPKLNNYLIVEPVDQSGRRWVQAQIASADWTRSVQFGQGDSPSGMRYRVYVLSTSTPLPVGELTKQTATPQESPAISVTLKK